MKAGRGVVGGDSVGGEMIAKLLLILILALSGGHPEVHTKWWFRTHVVREGSSLSADWGPAGYSQAKNTLVMTEIVFWAKPPPEFFSMCGCLPAFSAGEAGDPDAALADMPDEELEEELTEPQSPTGCVGTGGVGAGGWRLGAQRTYPPVHVAMEQGSLDGENPAPIGRC